jgi:hypothetical protein
LPSGSSRRGMASSSAGRALPRTSRAPRRRRRRDPCLPAHPAHPAAGHVAGDRSCLLGRGCDPGDRRPMRWMTEKVAARDERVWAATHP